jgi:hypothetical protein
VRALAAVLVLAASTAHADSKTAQLATAYDKEAASCHVREAGIEKVSLGADLLRDDAIADDVKQLHATHDLVKSYCDELDAVLALLRAPDASYKALEKQIDDHDNKIRPLRKASQKAIDDSAPAMGRLIPKINAARAVASEHVPATTSAQFPSGHKVKLPSLPGKWQLSGAKTRVDIAEYAESGASVSLEVRVLEETCAHLRELVAKRGEGPGASIETSEPKSARTPTTLAWLPAAAFRASYVTGGRAIQVECVPTKTAGISITLDAPDKAHPERDLSDVAAQMLVAAQAEK